MVYELPWIMHKDNEKMQRERADLLALINNPDVPESRKGIYRTTVAKIEALMGESQAASVPPPQNPTQAPKMPQERAEPPAAPPSAATLPNRAVEASEPLNRKAPVVERNDPSRRDDRLATAPLLPTTDTTTIHAPLRTERTVSIRWDDGEAERVTEGDAMRRFKSRFVDLENSAAVRQKRFEALPEKYETFWRCVGYYRALAEFWKREPSASDLQLGMMSDARSECFKMIQQHAKI
jgi:hypothetical protein